MKDNITRAIDICEEVKTKGYGFWRSPTAEIQASRNEKRIKQLAEAIQLLALELRNR